MGGSFHSDVCQNERGFFLQSLTEVENSFTEPWEGYRVAGTSDFTEVFR